MKPSLFVLVFSLLCLSECNMTNREAQACFDKVFDWSMCGHLIERCNQDEDCLKEVQTLTCDFPDDDNIFNGYCFSQLQQHAVRSKYLLDCFISYCKLTSNSKHDMTRFFQCSAEIMKDVSDKNCSKECYDEIRAVESCAKKNPVEECYNKPRKNQAAYRIVAAVREACLAGKSATQEPLQMQDL